MQVAPLRHTELDEATAVMPHQSTKFSHRDPVNPGAQWHWKPPDSDDVATLTHVPVFRHGLELHDVMRVWQYAPVKPLGH
jgi:hypothetical protein